MIKPTSTIMIVVLVLIVAGVWAFDKGTGREF